MKWISTKKKLPREGERVLLYTPYRVFGDDYSCVGDRESIVICTKRIGNDKVPIFTHWMPLPARP